MFTELSKAIQANKKLLILFGVLWALMLGVFFVYLDWNRKLSFFLAVKAVFP